MVPGLYYLTKARRLARAKDASLPIPKRSDWPLEANEARPFARFDAIYEVRCQHDTGSDPAPRLSTSTRSNISTTWAACSERLCRRGLPFVNGLLKKKAWATGDYCNQTSALKLPWHARTHQVARFYLRERARVCRSDSTTWSFRPAVHHGRRCRQEGIEVQKQYMDGAITNGERSNKVIQMWSALPIRWPDEMFGT